MSREVPKMLPRRGFGRHESLRAEVELPATGPDLSGRHHPKYVAAFRVKMRGERCQCPEQRACLRYGAEVHHELRGIHKDDRTIVWLSKHCHDERGAAGGIAMADAMLAQAFRNFMAYLDGGMR